MTGQSTTFDNYSAPRESSFSSAATMSRAGAWSRCLGAARVQKKDRQLLPVTVSKSARQRRSVGPAGAESSWLLTATDSN